MFSRDELLAYMNNCIVIGKILTNKDVDDIITRWNPRRIMVVNASGMEVADTFRSALLGSVEYEGLYLKINEKNQIILCGVERCYSEVDLGDLVDIIGEYAFLENHIIRKVFGLRVERIDKNAFRCSTVRKIDFHEVREIKEYAFSGCKLSNIAFNSIEIIARFAFFEAELGEVTIKSNFVYISHQAFAKTIIKKIALPTMVYIDIYRSRLFEDAIINEIQFNKQQGNKIMIYYEKGLDREPELAMETDSEKEATNFLVEYCSWI